MDSFHVYFKGQSSGGNMREILSVSGVGDSVQQVIVSPVSHVHARTPDVDC